MTKQHFIAFAKAIRKRNEAMAGPFGVKAKERDIAFHEMVNLVCEVARQFNPRFDIDRFLNACKE